MLQYSAVVPSTLGLLRHQKQVKSRIEDAVNELLSAKK